MNQFSLLTRVLIIPLLLILYGCTDDFLTATLTGFSVKSTPKANSLTLEWDKVISSNNQRVTYEIHLDEVLIKDSLIVSSYTIIGLKPETEYLVKVVAKDVSGNKKEVKNTFSTLVAVVPSDFTITTKDITNSGFTINWTEPTIEGEKGIKYDVSLNEEVVTTDLDVLTFTFSNLSSETSYNVKVTAKSIEFETTSTHTTIVKTTSILSPSSFTITYRNVTNSGFTIDWTASTVGGDEGIKYEVSLNEEVVTTDLDVLTYTFSNLSAETTYNVKVTAKSIEFETSSIQTTTVTTIIKPSPSIVNVSSKDITYNGFTIDWTESTVEGSQGVKYGISLNNEVVVNDLGVFTYTFSNLSSGTTYSVKVEARSTEFETTSTKAIVVTTLDSPEPSFVNVTYKDVTYSGFTIDWTESTVAGNQGVKYDVSLNDEVEANDLDVLTYTFSNLNHLTTYIVKVTAKSSEFQSTSSHSIAVTTMGKPSPTIFEISFKDISFNGFTIDWTESTVEDNQGVKYDVSLNDEVVATDLEGLTYTISNLSSGTTYNVKVTARSIEFETTLSVMKTVTTTVFLAPSEFTINTSNMLNFEFTIYWSESTIAGNQGVKYDVSLNNEVIATDLEETVFDVSDLEAGTTYEIKVTAKSVEFGTTKSKTLSVETKNGPKPDDFEIILEEIKARSLTINWSELTAPGSLFVYMSIYIDDVLLDRPVSRGNPLPIKLEPDTEYVLKCVSRSSYFGTTLEKELTFKTLALPLTFEVLSAKIYKSEWFITTYWLSIQVTNADLFEKVILQNVEYTAYEIKADETISVGFFSSNYEKLKNADVKEGIIYFTEGETLDSKTFTYTVEEE